MTNDAGVVQGLAHYDAWGTRQSGAVGSFGFTGELQQGGDVYLRARWYNAARSSFGSRDPYTGDDTTPYSLHAYQSSRWQTRETLFQHPAALHSYAYAHNNPTNWTDPTGMCVPWLDRDCRPVWELEQGLNWADGATYWTGVGETAVGAVVGPVQLVYGLITDPTMQADLVRGAQYVRDDWRGAAWDTAGILATPFTDIYSGIVCGDSNQLGRGLTAYALMLGGARWARQPTSLSSDLLRTRLNGVLYGSERLTHLQRFLDMRKIDLVLDSSDLGLARGEFRVPRSLNERPQLLLRSNATEYEVWHELSHYTHYRRIGPEAYTHLRRTPGYNEAEIEAYYTLRNSKLFYRLNPDEQLHALEYFEQHGGVR